MIDWACSWVRRMRNACRILVAKPTEKQIQLENGEINERTRLRYILGIKVKGKDVPVLN